MCTDANILEEKPKETQLAYLECDLKVEAGEVGLRTSHSRIYPSSWLLTKQPLEKSIPVVIESLVRIVLKALIVVTSMIFML